MRISIKHQENEAASILAVAVMFAGILAITVAGMMSLSLYRVRAGSNRYNSNQAYYHAENALDWACQIIADANSGGPAASFLGNFSVTGGDKTISVPYLSALASDPESGLKNAWVTVENHSSGVTNLYLITASAKVMDKVRTIQATVLKNPPSLVFDYEYFLNNWGWWWGSAITGDGDNRANWDFDFRDQPTVNGSVLANGHIASNEVAVDPLSGHLPFTGSAGSDPVSHVHSGAPRLPMPNLLDFSYYQGKAITVKSWRKLVTLPEPVGRRNRAVVLAGGGRAAAPGFELQLAEPPVATRNGLASPPANRRG